MYVERQRVGEEERKVEATTRRRGKKDGRERTTQSGNGLRTSAASTHPSLQPQHRSTHLLSNLNPHMLRNLILQHISHQVLHVPDTRFLTFVLRAHLAAESLDLRGGVLREVSLGERSAVSVGERSGGERQRAQERRT